MEISELFAKRPSSRKKEIPYSPQKIVDRPHLKQLNACKVQVVPVRHNQCSKTSRKTYYSTLYDMTESYEGQKLSQQI